MNLGLETSNIDLEEDCSYISFQMGYPTNKLKKMNNIIKQEREEKNTS
jgi:hypothetical protein